MSHLSQPVAPIAYRVADVAAMLRLSRSAAYRLLRQRDGLRGIRVGSSIRVLHTDLEAYLAREQSDEPTRTG